MCAFNFRATVRSLCVLLPVMGVTWVLGVFYVNDDTQWIQYLFAVLNSLQVTRREFRHYIIYIHARVIHEYKVNISLHLLNRNWYNVSLIFLLKKKHLYC